MRKTDNCVSVNIHTCRRRVFRIESGFLPQEVWDFSEGSGDELNFEEQAASGEEPSRREEHCRHNARC